MRKTIEIVSFKHMRCLAENLVCNAFPVLAYKIAHLDQEYRAGGKGKLALIGLEQTLLEFLDDLLLCKSLGLLNYSLQVSPCQWARGLLTRSPGAMIGPFVLGAKVRLNETQRDVPILRTTIQDVQPGY
eukprot:COSAG02_NODE_92_length_37588_cov_135.916242_33_plen_129_part_00